LPNFLAFRWRELNRLDFTVEDCQQFHRAAEEIVIPALVQLRAKQMADTPYPEIADPTALAAAVESMLTSLDPTFGAIFHAMRDGYLDMGMRPGKAVTSEQWFFPLTAMPYLHDTSNNLGTTLHECGHAIHAYLSFQAHPSLWNAVAPDEFQEFIATALYELCFPYYEQAQGGPFTTAENAAGRRRDILHDYLGIIAWGVMEDVFEHWVYGEAPEDVTPEQLDAKWLEVKQRFMPWEVAEKSQLEVMTGWQRWNWSLFRMPLYTIAYPIDTIAVCLLGRQLENGRASVLQNYKAALSLGNTKPVTELFRVAGIPFPFSHSAVEEALHYALNEYAKLAGS
jgi:oligoendopeptidase F